MSVTGLPRRHLLCDLTLDTRDVKRLLDCDHSKYDVPFMESLQAAVLQCASGTCIIHIGSLRPVMLEHANVMIVAANAFLAYQCVCQRVVVWRDVKT